MGPHRANTGSAVSTAGCTGPSNRNGLLRYRNGSNTGADPYTRAHTDADSMRTLPATIISVLISASVLFGKPTPTPTPIGTPTPTPTPTPPPTPTPTPPDFTFAVPKRIGGCANVWNRREDRIILRRPGGHSRSKIFKSRGRPRESDAFFLHTNDIGVAHSRRAVEHRGNTSGRER
jgi:hypothetical protein